MSTRGGTIAGLGRLMVGVVVCGAGILAVVPHHDAAMWQASVIVTEWGHVLGVLGAPFLLGWRRSWLHATAATLTAAGVILLWTPTARASAMAATLPSALHQAFGTPTTNELEGEPPRPVPLVWSDLFFGISTGDVLVDEHVYDVVDGESLTLDLYRPEYTANPRPIVVVIHGGGWTDGDKREFPALSQYLASRGYVVANVGYRLAPRWTFPAPQEDVRSAIRYLKDLETTHGIDPNRIALLGRSVGGQIALLAGYTSTDPAIRGIVSLYGPTALRWGYENPAKAGVIDSSGALDTYLGGPPATHGEQYDAAEPGQFVNEMTRPTLFVQGLRDEHVSPFHAEFVSSRLIAAGVPNLVVRMPWATHGCDFVFRGPCGQISTYAVEQFLGTVLGGEPGSVTAPSDDVAPPPPASSR